MKSIYNPRFWTQPLVATGQGLYGHATYPNVIGGVGSQHHGSWFDMPTPQPNQPKATRPHIIHILVIRVMDNLSINNLIARGLPLS